MSPRLTAVARPKPVAPLRREIERLLALADAIEAALPESAHGFLDLWREHMGRWMTDPRLETRDGERTVEALALELRYLWLRHAHGLSGRLLMSPLHGQAKRLPDSSSFGFPYDRWLKPDVLESRLIDESTPPPGWRKDALVFASGMAAISTVLHYHRTGAAREFPPGPNGPVVSDGLSVHWFGGYFEIARTLKLICDPAYRGRRHGEQKDFFKAVSEGLGDLLLIEPVAADLSLDVFDLDGFIAAWRKRPTNRATVLLIDSSLTGDRFPIDRLCTELGPQAPALMAEVRSGVKLDQQGLELSNVGLLSLYAPQDRTFANVETRDLAALANSFRQARTTFGAGLSADEYAALSAPFFLNPGQRADHAGRVFDNNCRFAHAVAPYARPEGGLINAVIHPCLGPDADKPWAVSPFVNIKYSGVGSGLEGDDAARNFFHSVLEYEARTRGLAFRSGSSFGFRAHRYEMGFVRGNKYDTLRVAIGARAGPSLDGVIELFQELAGYDDFQALCAAYAGVIKKREAP